MLSALALVASPRLIALDVTNVTPGETVRYPLLLLRGTCAGNAVIAGTSWKSMVKYPQASGHFAAAVELRPGPNFVLVQSARDTVKVEVEYQPMRTPYRVRAVVLQAKDEEPAPGTKERLDVALKMLQSVCAESMREAGHGRKTFPLELGPDGRVVVHFVRAEETGDTLRSRTPQALYDGFATDLGRTFDPAVDKTVGVAAFVRWDRRAGRGLGESDLGGGGLALVGGESLARWPASVGEIPVAFADATPVDEGDTGLRGTAWAATATGIGTMLHELGHTFGLPHSTDVRSVMLRGFDALNRRFVVLEPPRKDDASEHAVAWEDATHWDAFEASRLDLSPWFQPDGDRNLRFPSALPPRLSFEGDEVVVSAPYGLGLVGAVREGQAGTFREFKGAKTARIKRSELGEGAATLIAVDENGNQTDARLP